MCVWHLPGGFWLQSSSKQMIRIVLQLDVVTMTSGWPGCSHTTVHGASEPCHYTYLDASAVATRTACTTLNTLNIRVIGNIFVCRVPPISADTIINVVPRGIVFKSINSGNSPIDVRTVAHKQTRLCYLCALAGAYREMPVLLQLCNYRRWKGSLLLQYSLHSLFHCC